MAGMQVKKYSLKLSRQNPFNENGTLAPPLPPLLKYVRCKMGDMWDVKTSSQKFCLQIEEMFNFCWPICAISLPQSRVISQHFSSSLVWYHWGGEKMLVTFIGKARSVISKNLMGTPPRPNGSFTGGTVPKKFFGIFFGPPLS